MHILLAEDEAINRLYIRNLIRKKGWSVHEAADGEQALKALENERFDLILLDLGLPKKDGYEIAKSVQEHGLDVKILAVTGYDYPEDRKKIREAGMHGLIPKPIQEHFFYEEIQRVCP
ncbi:response regulator [Salinispira pacifica]|uniref:Two-component response regulator n=1 Tax=Salinispira pacifica TaxID=1307761 RepID=V5WKN9_9SPIO|nr:response regulator [Salinispira pacifica]AHC16392.1 Two-component response regulator [Salinispira pacifica]